VYDLLEHATPDEARLLALQSPLMLAMYRSPAVRPYPHTVLLDQTITALASYRLYPTGPGPAPEVYITTPQAPTTPQRVPGSDVFRALHAVPDNATETILVRPGASPTDEHGDPLPYGHPDRVLLRLAINTPPRHGKSLLVTETLPYWYHQFIRAQGFPGPDVAITTYSDEFAADWGEKARTALRDTELPPHPLPLTIPGRGKANLHVPAEGGRFIYVGAGGALTGKGYLLGIIDDPFKNQEDALSEAERTRKKNWYQSTFRTRKTKHHGLLPVEIMMFTRWHEDDLCGAYVYDPESLQVRPDWYLLHLPALADPSVTEGPDPLGRQPGEALCPALVTQAELEAIAAEDPVWFACLYQGTPSHEKGNLFPGDHAWPTARPINGGESYVFQDGAILPMKDALHFTTVDLAASTRSKADWTVFLAVSWWPRQQRLLLRRLFRDRITTDTHAKALLTFMEGEPEGARQVYIEDKSYGTNLIRELQRDQAGKLLVSPLKADWDKFTRAVPYAEAVKSGRVFIVEGVRWRPKFIAEHISFGSGRHDDQVDAGSYAWRKTQDMLYAAPDRPAGPDMSPEARAQRNIDRLAKGRTPKRGRSLARAMLR
jgi:predicted phage terminase large subunit-like protein